jgi:hypothetical protein
MIARLVGEVVEGEVVVAVLVVMIDGSGAPSTDSTSSLNLFVGEKLVFSFMGDEKVDAGLCGLDVPSGPMGGSNTALSLSKFNVVANLAAIGRRKAGAGGGGGGGGVVSTGLVSSPAPLDLDLFPNLKKRDLDLVLRRAGGLFVDDMYPSSSVA